MMADARLVECNKDTITSYKVVMIFDDNFFIPGCVALSSLILNAKNKSLFELFVLTTGLNEINRNILSEFGKNNGVSITVIVADVSKYRDIYKEYNGNTGAGSIIALLKFDIWNIINADKILYLDSDLIIKEDITELFNIDLEDNYAAVIEDSGSMYNNRRIAVSTYFNSGVMLLNCCLIRKDGLTLKLMEAKEKLNDERLVDQDAFNIVFDNRIHILPIKYNCLAVNLFNSAMKYDIRSLNKQYKTNYSCMYSVYDDAKIIHYASKDKPWLFSDSPFVKLWERYLVSSPIKTSLERQNKYKYDFEEVPIMLATDENYTPQTGITIVSALENRTYDVKYTFFVFTANEFSKETIQKFKQIESQYKKCSINILKMDENLFLDVKMNISHITYPTFFRLVAASKLPQYKKIIYLDSDIVVEQDLCSFFSTNMDEYAIAGVKGASYHWPADGNKNYCEQNGLPAIDQYVNAGVLLFNLSYIRTNKMEEEFIRLSKLGLRSQDQDVINRACYGHILHLPYKYNCMVAKYEKTPEQLLKIFTQKEINEANNCPIITHYAAELKPWADLSCALADRWWKYAKISPYYYEIIDKYHSKLLNSGVRTRFSNGTTNKIISPRLYNPEVIKKTWKDKLKEVLSKSDAEMTYKEMDRIWKSGNKKEQQNLFAYCSKKLKLNDPQIIGRLGRLYRDGKGTTKNVSTALVLLRTAAYRGISWAKGDYVDLLLQFKDPLSDVEAYSFCLENANDDAYVLECRLARMYKSGIGTTSDLNKAILWMAKAVKHNEGWAGEYIDLLLLSNNEKDWKEAFSFASQYPNDATACYKMACMYKEGKGTKKNTEKYSEYLNISAKMGNKKAIKELQHG